MHMSHGGGTFWKNIATLNGEKVCGIRGDDVRTTVRRTCAMRRIFINNAKNLAKRNMSRRHLYGVHSINQVPNTQCDIMQDVPASSKIADPGSQTADMISSYLNRMTQQKKPRVVRRSGPPRVESGHGVGDGKGALMVTPRQSQKLLINGPAKKK